MKLLEYRNHLKQFTLSLKVNKQRGRYIVATKILSPGELVLQETPTSFVTFKDECQNFCQNCLSPMKTPTTCIDCRKQSFWCSQTCKQNDEIHNLTCLYLIELPGISGSASVDYNLLRLMLAIIARIHLESTNSVKGTSTKFLLDLLSHQKSVSDKFKSAIKIAAKDFFDLFRNGPLENLSVEEIIKLSCRINSNSHAVHDPTGEANHTIGVGMFPMVAMLNHSCSPNAVYVTGQNGDMFVRCVKPINEGEEICVSYVDLFSPKWERRGVLLSTKYFWCECSRCECNDLIDPDHYMNSIKCDECNNGVLLPKNDGYECLECRFNCDQEFVDLKLKTIDLNNGMELYKAGMFDSAQISLQNELEKQELILHDHHYQKLSTYISLISLCTRQNDFIGGAEYNRKAIDQMVKIATDGKLGEFIPELANLYGKLGEILEIIGAGIIQGLIKCEKSVEEVREEMKMAYAKSKAIRLICNGEE